LANLYFAKQITLETAMIRSSIPDELTEMINRGPQVKPAAAAAKR
jgi:hypothetical protein